jgi:peptidyl-prolyl cis-trans isomerase SurA
MAIGVSLAALAGPGRAEPEVADRIVAVVGPTPITLSELRDRAVVDVTRRKALGNWHKTDEIEVFRAVLERMIDERLEANAATKAHVTVEPAEVAMALQHIAAAAKVTVDQLIEEAKRQGYSERGYSEEIGRQILEGKMLRARGLSRGSAGKATSEANEKKDLAQWIQELRSRTYVDVRL